MTASPTTGLALYSSAAAEQSRVMLSRYSSSFGAASRLLPAPMRADICAIYALVRIADEIVDGPAREAGARPGMAARECGALLDALETETYAAIDSGFSSNPIVHAFAETAREAGIGRALIEPFFASMRTDLHPLPHTERSIEEYIFGSAEVIGLMCVRVFLVGGGAGPGAPTPAPLERGARRLGAAFQKINFLRDLGADADTLGRRYFPGVDADRMSEAEKLRILADIGADLAVAREAIPGLPAESRGAVLLACTLFAHLAEKLRRTPAERIRRERVRLSTPHKLRVAAAVLAGEPARRLGARTERGTR